LTLTVYCIQNCLKRYFWVVRCIDIHCVNYRSKTRPIESTLSCWIVFSRTAGKYIRSMGRYLEEINFNLIQFLQTIEIIYVVSSNLDLGEVYNIMW
jgi:hypothetical protein